MKTYFVIVLAVLCMVAALYGSDLDLLMTKMSELDLIWAMLSLVPFVCGYFARAKRWQYLLPNEQVSMLALLPTVIGATLINNLLPLRAGEVYRIVCSPSLNLRKLSVFYSIVFEKILDLACLGFCFLFVIGSLSFSLVGTYFLIGTIFSFLIYMFACPRKMIKALLSCARQFRLLNTRLYKIVSQLTIAYAGFTKRKNWRSGILKSFALTNVIWLLEFCGFYLLAKACGIFPALEAAFATLVYGTLATAVPAAPGYVGTFHLAVKASLVGIGLDPTVSLSYAIVSHAFLWGAPFLLIGFATKTGMPPRVEILR